MKNKNYLYIFVYPFLSYAICFYSNNIRAGMINSQFNPSFSNSNQGGGIIQSTSLPQNNTLNQPIWEKSASNTNDDLSNKQFNWQQRKVIKQKAYKIYTNLNIVIEDINDIISKFSSKVNNIKQVVVNFENMIKSKCNTLNENYYHLNELMNYLDGWFFKINEFKKTVYYNLHKDFRKKIDAEGQNFENIKNMIKHYNNSITKMYSLEDSLINGVDSLYELQKTAISYEEAAWLKYQQLDELINDRTADASFLEITNYSDNAILINTYLRTEFLDFFNQGMENLNNANYLILSAVDDLINHINETNLFIDSLEQEIKLYDDNKQKEKMALELEEKIRLENELKLKEIKKQTELRLAEEQRSWYQKILSYVELQFPFIKEHAISAYDIMFNKLVYYYNLIFKKDAIISKDIKKNENSKKDVVLSNQVSVTVAGLPPLQNQNPEVVVFSSPDIVIGSATNILPRIVPTVNTNQLLNNNTGIPEETVIDDVFSMPHLQGNNYEKNKLGASSYPTRIIPMQNKINPNDNNQFDPNVQILSSEDIAIPNQNDSNDKENQEISLFQYKALEKNSTDGEQGDKLLPDLSNLAQQRTKSSVATGIDTSQESVRVFTATSSSGQSHARVRNVDNQKQLKKKSNTALINDSNDNSTEQASDQLAQINKPKILSQKKSTLKVQRNKQKKT